MDRATTADYLNRDVRASRSPEKESPERSHTLARTTSRPLAEPTPAQELPSRHNATWRLTCLTQEHSLTCTTCTNPTAVGIHLCETCSDSLYKILNDLPDLLEDLEVTTAKLDNTGTSGGSSHSGPVLPVNLGALETKMHLEIIIQSWSSMLNDYAPKHKRKPRQPHLTYLRGNINTIRTHDLPGAMHNQPKAAHRDAHRLVDLPRDVRILGTCNEPECTGQIKTDGRNDEARCDQCTATYNTADLEAWNQERTRGELMTAAQVRRYLKETTGITIKTKNFENWVSRGNLRYVLELVKTRGREKRLYYPGDVLTTHLQMTRK